jgi:hypothetical protein
MDFLIPKAYAAVGSASTSGSSFESLFQKIINNIVSPVIYLIMALAIVYFLYGVMQFIKNADNAEKRSEGYSHMIWGIVGIFIMVSA